MSSSSSSSSSASSGYADDDDIRSETHSDSSSSKDESDKDKKKKKKGKVGFIPSFKYVNPEGAVETIVAKDSLGTKVKFISVLMTLLPSTFTEYKNNSVIPLDFSATEFKSLCDLVNDLAFQDSEEYRFSQISSLTYNVFENGSNHLTKLLYHRAYILKVFGRLPESVVYVLEKGGISASDQVQLSTILTSAIQTLAVELHNDVILSASGDLTEYTVEALKKKYRSRIITNKYMIKNDTIVSASDHQSLRYAVWQYERSLLMPEVVPSPQIILEGNRVFSDIKSSLYIEYFDRIDEVELFDTCPLGMPKLIFELAKLHASKRVYKLSDLVQLFR